ncbi:hypothetical protein BJY54_006909 [Streptomyces nodosus]|nr:hypothetical protein [Streptomyces nodosus]
MRVWHPLWVERIDRKIQAVRRRQAEEERGRRNRPEHPDWIVEPGIGADRAPVQVHAGDSYIAGKRRRAVSRNEARRLLAEGLEACTHCEPDIQLNILDLPLISVGQSPVTDEGAGDAGEGQEMAGFAFVASVETSASGKPGHGAFDSSAVPAEPLAGVRSLARDPRCDAPSA